MTTCKLLRFFSSDISPHRSLTKPQVQFSSSTNTWCPLVAMSTAFLDPQPTQQQVHCGHHPNSASSKSKKASMKSRVNRTSPKCSCPQWCNRPPSSDRSSPNLKYASKSVSTTSRWAVLLLKQWHPCMTLSTQLPRTANKWRRASLPSNNKKTSVCRTLLIKSA